MAGGVNGRDWRAWVCAAVAMYVLFLLISPFEHHDLQCEIKTPQHCTACASSVVGSDPAAPVGIGARELVDAGNAIAFQELVAELLLDVRSTGRSPPAAS